MSLFLQGLLVWHVLAGLLGIAFFGFVLVGLMKKKVELKAEKVFSLLGLLFLLFSRLTGGYYYTVYYGKNVKPVIQAGGQPWIHGILMETKEHIFLFMPFLAVVIFLALWLADKKFLEDDKLKKSLMFLTLVLVILGAAIALMGIAISRAAV